jgi:hypothetical protein
VMDPVSGERVLVVADPHIRRSAYIYSLDSGKTTTSRRTRG